MKEKLVDIVNAIDACAKVRKGTGISTVGRVHCLNDGIEQTYWFTPYRSNVGMYGLDEVKKFGIYVPKNSDIAIKMQENDVGSSFLHKHLNNIKREVINQIVLENQANFQNQTIAIAGDEIQYQYRNICEFLNALQENKEDIEEVVMEIKALNQQYNDLLKQKGTSHQRGQITKTIKIQKERYRILTQQQEDLKNITIYIRKQGEMRYSPIVDTIQTHIKTQNLFDGKTLIINGGPGTGKTTTMIHRLAYLSDIYAIDEDEKEKLNKFKLNTLQRQQLRECIKSQRDWMFFSPSQMLKEYLADAMRQEGLENTSLKVWEWKEYCRLVLQEDYHLIGSSTSKAPFVASRQTDTLFYQKSGIIEELTNFYLEQLRQIKDQLPKLNIDGTVYQWMSIAKSIEKRFDGTDKYNIAQFIKLFDSLESVYGNECKELLHKKNELLNKLSNEIFNLLEQNKNSKLEVIDILEIVTDTTDDNDDDIDDTENEPEDKLVVELKKWLKNLCENRVDNNRALTDEQMMISEVVLPLLGEDFNDKIRKISELIIFDQFAKYTRGVKFLMLNGLSGRYRKFRTHLHMSKFEGCDLVLLRKLTQENNGKGLHYQEQSLLLGFINTLVKQIKNTISTNIKHVFVEAYDKLSRPIIGVDEATDFCECDIYAMQSLLTREYNSFTLCGDMMQRMTDYGITSWAELDNIVNKPIVVEMKTSYRQSRRLLEVARQIYTDTIGNTPSYKAFMKSTKVPLPLAFIDDNEHKRIQWISKRIDEVYRAYGQQMPSVAIFVNDKGYVPRFVENLKKTDFFKETGVDVLSGSDKNSKTQANHISVYPIDVVKGMEFDVVFFHNIDNSSANTEILKRYIYVGISRAAFFLAITLSEYNKDLCKYFEQGKDWFKI